MRRRGTHSCVRHALVTGAVTLISPGGRPEESVLSRDGTRLYTTNRVGDSITIVDTDKERRHRRDQDG